MPTLALSELLGAPVFDTAGSKCGSVRELALAPQEDRSRVAAIIVKTKAGDRLLPFASVTAINSGIRTDTAAGEWATRAKLEGMLLLGGARVAQQVFDGFGGEWCRAHN